MNYALRLWSDMLVLQILSSINVMMPTEVLAICNMNELSSVKYTQRIAYHRLFIRS